MSGQALTAEPRLHPVTLRFSERAWEGAFQAAYTSGWVRPVRVVAMITLTLTLTWAGLANLLFPAEFRTPLGVVLLAVTPLATCLMWAASYQPWFPRAMRLLVAAWTLWVADVFVVTNMVVFRALPAAPLYAVTSVMALLFSLPILGRTGIPLSALTSACIVAGWAACAALTRFPTDPGAYFMLATAACLGLVAGYLTERYVRDDFVNARLLAVEREKSERLLLNVLPAPIAERLKAGEEPIADAFAETTVLFADLVGFTTFSADVAPTRLVQTLNELFRAFDELTQQHGLEKIKTIGDAYMAVAGLPMPRADHAAAAADLALAMQQAVARLRGPSGEPLRVRIGLNTGPVVAGVIGTTKFAYDLWGDAVNTASRMESTGLPEGIQVSEATHLRLRGRYTFEERGEIEVKGKGRMRTYLLVGRMAEEHHREGVYPSSAADSMAPR